MNQRLGYGYLGTSRVETSSANQEIIPASPSDWTVKYQIHKFSFINYDETNVIINGTTNILLGVNEGFEMSYQDAPIYSFVIVNPNVRYKFIASY